jgi:ParB family chromosome partitioning protein
MPKVKAAKPEIVPLPDAVLIPLARIKPTADQPRSEVDLERVRALARDITEKRAQNRGAGGTGILHPLLVRWEPGAIQEDGAPRPNAAVLITAGETRYHAAKLAGLTEAPVVIVDQNEQSAYEDALTENLLRKDLSEEDEGRALLYLKNKHKLSFTALAKFVYRDEKYRGYVQNRIDALKLTPEVQKLVGRGKISMTNARRIQTVKDPDRRRELVDLALAGAPSKTIEARIRKFKGHGEKLPAGAPDIPEDFTPTEWTPNSSRKSAAPILPTFDISAELESIEGRLARIKEALGGAKPSRQAKAAYRNRLLVLKNQIVATERLLD